MKCPLCVGEILAGSRYCPSCGEELAPRRTPPSPFSSPTLDQSPGTASPPAGLAGARFVPGTLLAERYRIVALIGRGGMGEVYRAEDLRLGQTVALKFLPDTVSRNPAARLQMEREVRIARRISHPNVCRVFDIGETADGPFISMEFIDGEDLASLLKRIGRLPMDKGLQVAHQICTGLAAAHDLGTVHRDLKPANIMLDGRGRVRITDFGLAALAEELRSDHVLAGTPAYMAPEQIGGGQVTPRTDIYAVGLVMYELFSGKQALPRSTASDLHRRRAALPVRLSKLVRDLDPGVERIVSRCLQVDPGERPGSAMEVAAALPGGDPLRAAIAAGETPSPDTVAAAGEPVAMPRGASIALLAAVLLGVALSAYLSRYASVLTATHGGKPPEVLAERAREVISRFGYSENGADSAWWLEPNRDDLASLPRGSPDGMHFVFRRSPRPLAPQNYFGLVDSSDPPPGLPGMITVVLDARGLLRGFSAVPVPAAGDGASPPDWLAGLSQAGVTSAQLAPPDLLVVPPTPYDARQDWQATDGSQTVAITAAAYRGRLVYFRDAPVFPTRATIPGGTRGFAGLMFVVAAIVCGVGGCFLARRNMRRGRGDRQGAFRIAAFIFLAEFLGWLLSAHFVPAASADYDEFIGGCGESLYVAAFMWVLYMAIEPYVRRRWPRILISWTRLLSGNLYDSRIGRDVLFGALGGAAMAVIQNGVNALPAWFPVANVLPAVPSPLVLRGPMSVLAALFVQASISVQWALAAISFLLVSRVVVRRDWLAVLVSGVSLGMVVLAADNFLLAATAAMLCSAIVFGLLFRFGLLSVAVTLFSYFLLRRWPLSLDFSQWFAWRSVFSISVLLAIALYGFLAVNAGRPLFAESAIED